MKMQQMNPKVGVRDIQKDMDDPRKEAAAGSLRILVFWTT
jgi:hypothetical protein